MNESALNKIKSLVEARRVSVLSASSPEQQSITLLKESGYLASEGKVREEYVDGLAQEKQVTISLHARLGKEHKVYVKRGGSFKRQSVKENK